MEDEKSGFFGRMVIGKSVRLVYGEDGVGSVNSWSKFVKMGKVGYS